MLALEIKGSNCKTREQIFFETQPIIVYRLTAKALCNIFSNEHTLTQKMQKIELLIRS